MDLPLWNDGIEERKLSLVSPPPGFTLKRATGSLPDLPEEQLQPFDIRENTGYPVKVKDQNGKGACVGHGSTSALEDARYIAGLPYVELSPWFVYSILCNGIDRGASISEALDLLQTKGTCPFPEVAYGTINPRNLTQGNFTDAEQNTVEIGYELSNFHQMCVAAHLRMPFAFSLSVNSNFDRLDSNGIPQNRPGYHNHCVQGGIGLKRLPNGKIALLGRNSWSTKWGQDGYFWFTEETVEGQGWDSWCVLGPKTGSNSLPPVAKH